MSLFRQFLVAILPAMLSLMAFAARASDAPAAFVPREHRIPYWLSNTRHIVVQAQVNGKGPYHFIFDTGAPHTFIVADVAQAANVTIVKPPREGRIAKLEIPGGPSFYNFAVGIDEPNQFQLRTINSAMPAGKRIVGFIGCAMVSRYRLDIDYTKPFMIWTEMLPRPPKADDPPDLKQALAADDTKAARAAADSAARPGYLGFELDTQGAPFKVTSVHKGSPAESAGLRMGDAIEAIGSRELRAPADIAAASAQVTDGGLVVLRVQRGGQTLSVEIKAGSGF